MRDDPADAARPPRVRSLAHNKHATARMLCAHVFMARSPSSIDVCVRLYTFLSLIPQLYGPSGQSTRSMRYLLWSEAVYVLD